MFPIALLAAGVSVHVLSGQSKRGAETTTAAPTPAKQNLSAVKPAADVRLGDEIDRSITSSGMPSARIGIFITSLRDGRIVYSRNSDQLFLPASNMKIYTTAVALDLLGPDYRWRTSVYAAKQPDASGVIDGDLVLYGRGAPDLISKPKGEAPSLTKFADQIYQAGVREVRGNLVGDESYFSGEQFGIGWQWNDLQWYFGAQPSALSVDENSFEITVAPAGKQGSVAAVAINPNDKFIHVTNNTTTGERDAVTTIGIIRQLSTNDVRVWGEFPVSGHGFSAFLSIDHPALWAATMFKQALIARGIKIDGEARSRDFRSAESDKFDPQKAFELAAQESEPLAEIVHRTNKESNNLFAELLLRTLGKERGSLAPDPDERKNRARGDDEAGDAVIKSWLEQRAIWSQGSMLRDGSGLSRLDLITPETTARLLAAMSRANAASVFHDSLPVAGRDGTLAGRLKQVAGKISAKTGSLTYVHSLSGYSDSAAGEVLVFSILTNDTPSDRTAIALIDQIATEITAFGNSSSAR